MRRLGHAVDVEALDAEALLDAAARLVGERLRAEDADLEVGKVALALGALVKLLNETRNIRDDRRKALRLEVLHQLDLAFGVAGRRGNREEPRLSGTVVEAEAAVEKTERRDDLERVALLKPSHRVAACHALCPLEEVVLRVRHDDWRAGRAGRHVELEKLFPVHAVHLERIGVAEIVLREEGKLRKVVERLHVLGRAKAALFKPLAVELVAPHAGQRLLQSLKLHLRVFVARQRFLLAVPHRHVRPPLRRGQGQTPSC